METSASALADLIRTAYGSIATAAEKLGDQVTWQPLGKGQSALSQLHECTHFAQIGTHILRTGEFAYNPADRARIEAENPDGVQARASLLGDGNEFARAIEAASPETLAKTIALPSAGMTKTIAETVMLVYWNTVYHEGQVNYIETLTPNYLPG